MFIELHLYLFETTTDPILVNVSEIKSVRTGAFGRTLIRTEGNIYHEVTETYDEVKAMILGEEDVITNLKHEFSYEEARKKILDSLRGDNNDEKKPL